MAGSREREGASLVLSNSGPCPPDLDHDLTPLRRLASASQDALVFFCEAIGRSPTAARVFDRLDERLARLRREAFGRRGWLLSWQRRPDGSWLARLSGPGLARTIERSARTRSCAILRTARVMARIRAFRAQPRTCPGPDPDSQHATTP